MTPYEAATVAAEMGAYFGAGRVQLVEHPAGNCWVVLPKDQAIAQQGVTSAPLAPGEAA